MALHTFHEEKVTCRGIVIVVGGSLVIHIVYQQKIKNIILFKIVYIY